jgi:hypothetical protein
MWRKTFVVSPSLFFKVLVQKVQQGSSTPVRHEEGSDPEAYGEKGVPWVSLSNERATVRVYYPVMGELRVEIETCQISGSSEEYLVPSRLDRPRVAEKEAEELASTVLHLLANPRSWQRVRDGYVFPLPSSGEFFFQE